MRIGRVINAETDAVSYYSYDAWGNPRDNDDWTTKIDADLFADRGFTGHEHLVEFGLIDMNGRVYDPMLGRMLSPDPYVQLPGYADNFNRYSYCFNNPLVYTDPDGNNPFLVWLGIAAIKLAGNYIFQVAENKLENKMSWQESVSLNNTSFIIDYQQPLHWSADQQSTVPYDNSYGSSGIMPMIIQKEETYNSIYDFPLFASNDNSIWYDDPPNKQRYGFNPGDLGSEEYFKEILYTLSYLKVAGGKGMRMDELFNLSNVHKDFEWTVGSFGSGDGRMLKLNYNKGTMIMGIYPEGTVDRILLSNILNKDFPVMTEYVNFDNFPSRIGSEMQLYPYMITFKGNRYAGRINFMRFNDFYNFVKFIENKKVPSSHWIQ